MNDWKFNCPVCKSEQNFIKDNGEFWCEGCRNHLMVRIGGAIYDTGSVDRIRQAIKEGKLVVK